MKKQFLLLFVALLMATLSSWAQTTRLVPSGYLTIQAAIDASIAGDIIQVETGTLIVTS